MSSGRSRYPFTATQWQELELQALVFKYMISGMPIPPDLLFTIRTSLDSSISSAKFLLHQVPQHGNDQKKICKKKSWVFIFIFLILCLVMCIIKKGLVFCSWMEQFSLGFWKKSRP